MIQFTNKAGKCVEVTPQKLRGCLDRAVKKFGDNDTASLLQPRRKPSGQFVSKKEKGWGGASERSIAHRLAVYLECELRQAGIVEDGGLVVVDCEYNRHLDCLKHQRITPDLLEIVRKARRRARKISDDSGYYVVSVSPDIVVHQRGQDALNLLVVEVKKKSNPEITEYDTEKLKCFTKRGQDEYGYLIGFSVIAVDNVQPEQREIKLGAPYANGKQKPDDYAA